MTLKFEMARLNQITQALDEIALLLAKLKECPSTPALSERIKHLCERRTKILANLGWLPFTPLTLAAQQMRSVEQLSNGVQESLLTENHTKVQRSASVARASSAQVSPRRHAGDVDLVQGVKASVAKARWITIPRTPEDMAPLSRRRGNQRVETEDSQFELVPRMTAHTERLHRHHKREKTEAEDMQLQGFYKKSDAVVWHCVPSNSRIIIPRTPEDTAPRSRRWGNQRVKAAAAQFTPVSSLSADTAPLQRHRKRQRTEAENMQLRSFNKRSGAAVWQCHASLEKLEPLSSIKEASGVRPRRITIPRTPEDTAPLWRRREKQRVEAEDSHFESVLRTPADTSPFQRRQKRQRIEAEDVQLSSTHKSRHAVTWHRVPSGTTWLLLDQWNRSWPQSGRSDASAWHHRQSSTSETRHPNSFVKPSSGIIPRTPEDTAPRQRCRARQRTEAENTQLVSIPRTPEDTAPLEGRRMRQRIQAEEAQLPSTHKRRDVIACHQTRSSITWSRRDRWSRSWPQSRRSAASAWHRS